MGRAASIGGEVVIGTRKAKAALREVKADMVRAAADMGKIRAPQFNIAGGAGKWTEINSRATAAKNIIKQVYDVVKAPAQANAWYQDLKDGLTAVMGNADKAKAHLGQLRLISDEQSLSDEQFEALVEYSVRLQSMGHSAEEAAGFLREVANTAEGMGKGVESFEGMIMAMDLMNQKGEESVKQIINLSKAIPAFRKVLSAGFGTDVPAQLEAMEMTSKQLFEGIMRGMKMMETARPSATEEGLSVETRKMQTMGADAEDNNGELARREQKSAEETANARAAAEAAMKEAKAQRAAEEAAKEREAATAYMERQEEIGAAENKLALARAAGDDDAIAAAEDRLDVMQQAEDLAEKLKISEEEAAGFIRQQNAARRETDRVVKDRENAKSQSGEFGDLAIETARARGQERRAKRLEKQKFLSGEKERLMGMGYGDKEAESMAGQKQRNKEDEEYFQKTGRRRVHGAKGEQQAYGLDNALGGPSALIRENERGPKTGSNIPGFDAAVHPERSRSRQRIDALKEERGKLQGASEKGEAQLSRLDQIKEELTKLNESILRGSMRPAA